MNSAVSNHFACNHSLNNGHSAPQVSPNHESLPGIDLLSIAKEKLDILCLRPESHDFLANVGSPLSSRIPDHLRRSFCFAEGIISWHVRGAEKGQDNSFLIGLCSGISAAANDRLWGCVEQIEASRISSEYVDSLKDYLTRADQYLALFGASNSFFQQEKTQVNGVHSSKLEELARSALNFVRPL